MNVVVIVTDTWRRDHMGLYGNTVVRTPWLDRFSERCVVFDRAYLASFPTMPMRADLYTGKFTAAYLGWAPLPEDEVILPQLMSDAGYRTAAVVDTPFFVRNGYGYDRGFGEFDFISSQPVVFDRGRGKWIDTEEVRLEQQYEEDHCAPRTCAHAEKWIEKHHKDKFFLYVDTWDPHEPWVPPAHYVKQYYPKWNGTIVMPAYGDWKKGGLSRKDLDIARACYAGKVTMVDRAIGRLIERLDSMGLLEKTIVVVTSDHGFYFGEHRLFGKMIFGTGKEKGGIVGGPLYEEVARVPLMIHMPGANPGRTNAIIQHIDLMPTILSLAGAEAPDTVHGKSFASVVKTGQGGSRSCAVSAAPLHNPGQSTRVVDNFSRLVNVYLPATITTNTWSMLYRREGAPVELYALKSGAQQKKNVAAQHPRIVSKLHRQFYEFIKEAGASEEILACRERV